MEEREPLWMVGHDISHFSTKKVFIFCTLYLFADIKTLTLNDDNGVSVSFSAVTTAIICLLVTVSVGMVLCWCMWYKKGKRQISASEGPQQRNKQMKESIYDEPLDTVISLSDNQAYGCVSVNQRN